MLSSRWLLVCLLASLYGCHVTSGAPQEDLEDWSTYRWVQIDHSDFITEDELDEGDLDNIADEIANEVLVDEVDEGPFARGKVGTALKVVGNGLKKGGKKVGTVILTAGKKMVKATGKGIVIAGKTIKKVGKTAGKGLLKAGKAAGKGLKKVGVKSQEFVTKKGQKIWGSIKNKMNGEVAEAGKQLLKRVGKEVLEQGASLAVEAVTPMIIEYAMEKTQEGLCSCDANYACTCCAQPPGFDRACLVMRIRPNKKIVNAALTYNGEELAKLDITDEKGPSSCTKLRGLARFIQACIAPIGIGELDNGFRGCLSVVLEPISLERTICVDFKGTRKDGSANFVPVSEVDEIEIGGEEEES